MCVHVYLHAHINMCVLFDGVLKEMQTSKTL